MCGGFGTPPKRSSTRPEFHRDQEISIAAAVPIEPQVELVVIEGNYLLAPERPWGGVRGQFDEIWYCERDDEIRIADLIARHRTYGKSEEEAVRWVLESDQRNAELIEATRPRADLVVKLGREIPRNALEEPDGLPMSRHHPLRPSSK